MTKITKEDVVGFIENMTVLELSELVKELEEKFGVSAAAMPMTMGAPASAAADASAAAKEEKTEFDVMLQAAGEKKIQVIKVVRALTELKASVREIDTKVDDLRVDVGMVQQAQQHQRDSIANLVIRLDSQ